MAQVHLLWYMGDHGSSSVVNYTNGVYGFATLLKGLGGQEGWIESVLGWLKLSTGS
jgi:hypothetical protein